jgi:hypothetical protein
VDEEASLQKDDEVVLLTHIEKLAELKDRWDPESNKEKD